MDVYFKHELIVITCRGKKVTYSVPVVLCFPVIRDFRLVQVVQVILAHLDDLDHLDHLYDQRLPVYKTRSQHVPQDATS